MNRIWIIIFVLSFASCGKSESHKKEDLDQNPKTNHHKEVKNEVKTEVQEKKEEVKTISSGKGCDYLRYYKDKGNGKIDTVRIKGRIIDRIDDYQGFKKAKYDFFVKNNKVYRKSVTHRFCNDLFIDIEFFQDLGNRIDLNTYKAYNKTFFSTRDTVKFWWANSGGHLILPVNDADPKTFTPSQSFCGGFDKNGVLYGSPNWGVYRLNIPDNENYELIPKKNSYWNTPEHYLISNGKVYDVKFDSDKNERYYCELNTEVSINEVIKLKLEK